jgi:polysaccharide export outer membrane protein
MSLRHRAALLLVVFVGPACGSSLPRAPTTPAPSTGFEQGGPEVPAGLAEDPAEPEVLLAGDVLTLHIDTIPPVERTNVVVDATGVVSVPLVGSVEIAGRSLSEAEDAIATALADYDRLVRVSLVVTERAGHRATVVGVVESPGMFTISGPLRLADLYALAGGAQLLEEDGEMAVLADLRGARLVRGGESVPVSLHDALEGDPAHNVRIHAGDLLFVPPARSQRISVLGSVHTPRVIRHRAGMRLSEVLALAGGATTDAELGDVRIVRGPLSAPQVFTTSVSDLVNGSGRDVVLEPGDVVFVTEHWLAGVGRVVDRLTPLLAVASLAAGFAR